MQKARPSSRKGCPNYPLEYKLQVAKAACEPDASVAKLARAHGLNANMIFKWRRYYRAGLLGRTRVEKIDLLPVTVGPEPRPENPVRLPAAIPSPVIEIELNGALVRITGMVDPMQLRLVLRCLMPA